MPINYETLDVTRDGRIATVTVNRPEAHNAISKQTLLDIGDAVNELSSDGDVHVVVLTGAGDTAFISGGDLKEFSGRGADWFLHEYSRAVKHAGDAIEDSPKPVIAAVNGVALGGGTEVAIMCDFIVASEEALFGFPEAGLGVIPGAGGTQRIVHLIGVLEAKKLILTSEQISAEQALEMGLVTDVWSDDEFYDRVYELAEDLAEIPPRALWFGKRAVNQTRANLKEGLNYESALAGLLFDTEDKEEGMDAFLEKRDPDFSDWQNIS